MVSMKASVSKTVWWTQTAIIEAMIEIEETTTSRAAVHFRCRNLPDVVSISGVN